MLERELGSVLYWVVMVYGVGFGVLLTAGAIFVVGAAAWEGITSRNSRMG
jgi:uncharacterized membrane protein